MKRAKILSEEEEEEEEEIIFYLPKYAPHLNLIETLWRKIELLRNKLLHDIML
jgi:transposase